MHAHRFQYGTLTEQSDVSLILTISFSYFLIYLVLLVLLNELGKSLLQRGITFVCIVHPTLDMFWLALIAYTVNGTDR